MIKYDCHFDASYTPGICRGGFCISKGSSLEKQSVRTLGANTSDMAEAEILHKLLDYINLKIERGKRVCIYGDAQGLIISILRGNKGSDRYKNVRKKYKKMCTFYDLSIEFIPREKNKRADALSKHRL